MADPLILYMLPWGQRCQHRGDWLSVRGQRLKAGPYNQNPCLGCDRCLFCRNKGIAEDGTNLLPVLGQQRLDLHPQQVQHYRVAARRFAYPNALALLSGTKDADPVTPLTHRRHD